MTRRLLAALATTLTLAPTIAFAHPGFGEAHDFTHGFLHPLNGVDHIIAMVAIGMLAARLGGRALWLMPAAFVTVMAAAGVIGAAGIVTPYVETGIALSVLVLGAAVAFDFAMPTALAVALVGFFAIFHGHAHGTEMPATASGLSYGLGFVAATVMLHAIGIGLGLLIASVPFGRRVSQIAGVAAAIIGAALLAGVA